MVAVTATRTNPGPPHHGTLEQTESNLVHRRAKKVCSSCCQHPAFIELASGKHCPQRSPCPSESFSGDLATKTWYVLWKSPRRPEFIIQLRHELATSRPSGSFRYSQRRPVTLAAAAMPLHAHALRATSKETVRFMCGSLPLFCADALPKQPDVYHKSQMPQAWLVQAAVRVAAARNCRRAIIQIDAAGAQRSDLFAVRLGFILIMALSRILPLPRSQCRPIALQLGFVIYLSGAQRRLSCRQRGGRWCVGSAKCRRLAARRIAGLGMVRQRWLSPGARERTLASLGSSGFLGSWLCIGPVGWAPPAKVD